MKKNIWLDGMMGLIVGDALGVPVQFMTRAEIAGRTRGPVTEMESGGAYNMPVGTWSDDSSMALCILDSVRELGEVSPKDIMERFVKWETEGAYTPFGQAFDEGGACLTSIHRYMSSGDVTTCGKTGDHANGNGALMRNLPLCLYYIQRCSNICTSSDEAIDGIHRVGALTHNHLRSKMACGLYYFMAKQIVYGSGSLREMLQKGLDEGFAYYGKDLRNLTERAQFGRLTDLNEFAQTPENGIKSSGYVMDTIEAVVWCLINTDNYRDCMLKAVNLGDDTDTVAAIAGGLAGLYYGYEEIPKEWLAVIQKREWLEELIAKM